jgi:hypothetical protein
MAGVGVAIGALRLGQIAIGALQIRQKAVAAAIAITVLSTGACLVYGFLLIVLTFCAVPATN